jgi:hypothetical protein
MPDGAPPRFLPTVRQRLNRTLGEQWIGRGGPLTWSARSSDLNISGYLAVRAPEIICAFGADQ